MAASQLCLFLFLLTTSFPGILAQSTSVAQNAFDSLEALGCTQFKSIIMSANRQERYKSAAPLTVFVFNDTAYARLPPYRKSNLYDRESDQNKAADEYVSSFTINSIVETSSFTDAAPQRTLSLRYRKLFLNRRDLRIGDVASGLPGPTKYFVNGGMIIRPNIQAGKHVIHIVDRVLPIPLQDNALAYVSGLSPSNTPYQFYKLFMSKLDTAPQQDNINNYDTQVRLPMSDQNQPVTFFLPSNEAVNKIPSGIRGKLLGNTALLLKIITLHIVPKKALFTSLVNHNEQFNAQYKSGRVVFRKNFDREAVYVTGALSGGGTVTARISPANVTVINGVIHHINEVLGFVYKSVLEEISLDPVTQNFEQLCDRARADLRSNLNAASGVSVFVPTNEAMQAILNRYDNYINNQSLINMVLEMSLLQTGQIVSLTDHTGGYESFDTARSRYNNQLVKIYSAGNDTWVEGGYVKARVVKPDIGCTNGVVHQIDAVFGIPTRDLPYTIYCEDRLVSTFVQIQYVGLDKYMRDPTLLRNQACQFSASARAGSAVPNDGVYGQNLGSSLSQSNFDNNAAGSSYDRYSGLCGDTVHRCQFTFFVPNGTAIDNFARTTYGRNIMEDVRRWRWILRRLITYRDVIYLDRIAPGQQVVMYADNGEEVIIHTDSRSNIPSGQRTAYIRFEGVEAQIIHSDIGATNGVMHIISNILFVSDDLTRDVSGAPRLNGCSLAGLLFMLMLSWIWGMRHLR